MKNDIFINNLTKIHFIGIGGISLSALAKLMQKEGKIVTGSDVTESKITKDLQKLGIKVFLHHKKSNIKGANLIIFSSAIKKDNIELIQAKKLGIKTLERADFLGLIAKNYENIIAISGSHGKTTTCGMIASIFICAGCNPTVHIGGESETTNGNMYIGGKEYFISEACEYKDSFLKMHQTASVVLNIDNDHTDYFKTINAIYLSFQKFIDNSKHFTVIKQEETEFLNINNKTITFSVEKPADYTAKNIYLNKKFHTMFTLFYKNENLGECEISSPLFHNVYNALSSIAVARKYLIPLDKIKEGLLSFTGVKRRFEIVREYNGNLIIHDYAHHPTQILSTIKACAEIYKKPIIVVFQPHTYSRTKDLMPQFLHCFNDATNLIITSTYKAREKSIRGGRAKDLWNNLKKTGKNYVYKNNFSKVKKYLQNYKDKNVIILVLGAGTIEQLAYDYLK